MSYFLIVYRRSTGERVALVEYPLEEVETAQQELLEREIQNRESDDLEAVLLGPASLEQIRETHPRYFDNHSVRLPDPEELRELIRVATEATRLRATS